MDGATMVRACVGKGDAIEGLKSEAWEWPAVLLLFFLFFFSFVIALLYKLMLLSQFPSFFLRIGPL